MRFVRGIEKIRRSDRIRIKITREIFKMTALQETMEMRGIQWVEHMKKMGNNTLPRIVLETEERWRWKD